MNSTTRPHATIGWLKPLLAVFAALGVVTLLMAPMMAIKPRDLPIAVANLDAGASTPQGELNVGDQVVAQLTGSNMNGMVKWVTYASQSEIDEALESNEVYGAFVVPADFTASSAAAQQGVGEAAPIIITVNQGKNPMISGQLSTAFNSMAAGDLPVVQQVYHPIPAVLGLSAMFLPMLFVLMTYVASLLGGFTTRAAFPLRATGRWKTLATQTGIAVLVAIVVGCTATWIVNSITGAGLPFADFAIFLGLACLAVVTIVLGSLNWLGIAGVAVPALILVLGSTTASLAYEALPGFWQNFVYPWNPLRFLGDGVRALAFQDAGWWNAATGGLLAALAVGLVLMATSVLTPIGRKVAEPKLVAGQDQQ